VSSASLALLLEIPVVAVALRGHRRATYATALGAALVLALLLPPVGTLTVHVADDLVALVVFLGVALVIGRLVSGRVELLAEVERQREAILRSVSHDLRTPLGGIRAAATELSSGARHDEPTQRALLGVIDQETDRLDRLVANLLSLSRSRAGALRPNLRPVDVEELLTTAATRLARYAGSVAIEVDAPELPEVDGDYLLLEQLVTNLLENAIRHSPADGTVRASAHVDGPEVVLAVEDDGPGVPAEDRDAIFEAFETRGGRGSTGLGLAICRAVAHAHHGSIGVEASDAGGARFVVRLPHG